MTAAKRARHRAVPGPESHGAGQSVDAAEAMAEANVETSV